MNSRLFFIWIFSGFLLSYQDTKGQAQKVISDEVQMLLTSTAEKEILRFRASICGDKKIKKLSDSPYQLKALLLKDVVPNGSDAKDYHMFMNVVKWTEETPKLNSYLIKKNGLQFTNGRDTVTMNRCNDLLPYDDRFLIYYKEGNKPLMLSGNIFHQITPPFIDITKELDSYDAYRIANFRLAQFNPSHIYPFPGDNSEKETYFQLKVDQSPFSPVSAIIQIPKSDPFHRIDIFYFTNDTAITRGDVNTLHKVKYTIHTNDKSTKQDLNPIITAVKWTDLVVQVKHEHKHWNDVAHIIALPLPESSINITHKLDTVYFTSEDIPRIIIQDVRGKKTSVTWEDNMRYRIKYKGKLQAIITEHGEVRKE